MTRGRSTVTAVLLLASLPLILPLTLLTPPAACRSARWYSWPRNRVPRNQPALVQGRLRCLGSEVAQADTDPHSTATHSTATRLSHPAHVVRDERNGHRLAIIAAARSSDGDPREWRARPPASVLRAQPQRRRVCPTIAPAWDSEPRRPPRPVPAAKVAEDLHVLLAGSARPALHPRRVVTGGFFIRLMRSDPAGGRLVSGRHNSVFRVTRS